MHNGYLLPILGGMGYNAGWVSETLWNDRLEYSPIGDEWETQWSVPSMNEMIPPRILGDFKIQRELGRGGMGVVYLARQLSLVRDVALKLLPPDAGLNQEQLLRFQREAALLGRLSHPNIVQVFLVGQEAGFHYLAMEYVAGVDLERMLRDPTASDRPEAYKEDFARASVRMARDLARALGAAHAEGIVHRDVKPSNILISADGRPCLADFGLARDLSAAALTTSGTALGTPYYMSPERYGAGEPTPASDVYALGAVLYECLAGKRVFDGGTPAELMAKILHDEPVPLRKQRGEIDRDLQTIVMKCLEKEPGRRYPDGYALASDLTRYLAGEAIEASPLGLITQTLRRVQRRKTPLPVLLGVMLVAVAGFAWGYYALESSRTRETLNEIEVALSHEEIDRAQTLMTSLLKRHPDREDIRFARADLKLRERQFAAAADDFEALIAGRLDPVAARIAASLARSIAEDASQQPKLEEIEATTARQAYYRALTYQARKERELALEENKRALELDPGYVEALYSLGVTYLRLDDLDRAEETLMRYRKLRSRADVDNHLGNIQWMKKNYEAALVSYQRFAAKRPDSGDAWNSVAAAHLARAIEYIQQARVEASDRERRLAGEALEKARALDATSVAVVFNEAVLAIVDDDLPRAEERFQAACRQPVSSDRLLTMGVWFATTLDAAGESELALQYLSAVGSARPNLREHYLWVSTAAEILDRLGRRPDALAILDESLAGSQHASLTLRRLRDRIASGPASETDPTQD